MIPAIKNVDISKFTGNQHVMLNIDIVLSDIPLLLFQKSMKEAHTTLDFKSNQAVVFGVCQTHRYKVRTLYNTY